MPYLASEAQARLKMGRWAWRSMCRQGLRVVYMGRRCYVLGDDLIEHFRRRTDPARSEPVPVRMPMCSAYAAERSEQYSIVNNRSARNRIAAKATAVSCRQSPYRPYQLAIEPSDQRSKQRLRRPRNGLVALKRPNELRGWPEREKSRIRGFRQLKAVVV